MLEAADEKSVAENLASSGYYATSIKARDESPRIPFISKLRGVRRREIVMFSGQLSTMIKAGMPLLSGIEILIEQTTDPVLNSVLREIRLDLNEGSSFTLALSKHPHVFSQLYIATVKVGEETGGLEEVLAQQADFIEWEDSLRAAIVGSLLYPVVVMCVAIGVAVFLLTVVLPKFREVYARARIPLPTITRIMFAVSWFVTTYWYVIFAAVIALLIGYILFKRTPSGHLVVDRFKLRVPIVKEFIGKVAAVRFARSLEIMARSGVAVVGALHIIRETMTNAVFAHAIEEMSSQVESGRTIGSALGDHREFDPMLVQMVAVGEETGQLDEMLGFVGDAYEQQIDYMSKNLPKVIEPILLIFLAGMVAVLALSLFLPIFQMAQVVENIR